jgi:glycosyltransferase involved in cell wall biosynthesis
VSHSGPRVLAILPAFIPSTIICVVKPLIQLHRHGHITAKITLESLVNLRNIQWADLVVFCRNTEPRYAHLVNFLLSRNVPFIYDLDDNFFELPLDSELGKYYRSPERLDMLNSYMRLANLIRVYSEPLLQRAQINNPKVEKVFGPIDLSLISSRARHSNSEMIKIVYATSRFDDELATIFLPALKEVLNDYAGKIEAHFWGWKPSGRYSLQGVRYHNLISNYERFLHRFSKAGYDIGLAPLKDDIFHKSKTNNKFREYGACRIAGVYSNVEVYSSCVTDGETGLLVSNESESWYKAILRLIENTDLREKIKLKSQEYVRQHYSQEDFEKVWLNQIHQVLPGKETPSILKNPVPTISQSEINNSITIHNTERFGRSNIAHLAKKAQHIIRRVKKNGLFLTFQLVQWRLYDYWMVLKLHFVTSRASPISNRQRL